MARGASHTVDVLVVCSAGGHLFDACAISEAWSGRERAWVSFDKPDVRSLLRGERVYFGHGPTNRHLPNLVRNVVLAWSLVGRTRPRVIVTTGAGLGVPFAWVGRLRGARVIYVECAGRTDRPSLSARLIAPVAARLYAQWPDLAASWRGARYEGNVLLAQRPRASGEDGHGIVVTVGTNEAPFDRLVAAAETLSAEAVVVQRGASRLQPSGVRCVDYLSFDEFDTLVRSCRVVVTHAGVGSVAAALANGRKPIVVPRLHRFGEAVDDHQVSFARRLEEAGLVTVVDELHRLPEVVASAVHVVAPTSGPDLSRAVRRDLDSLLRRRGERRARRLAGVVPLRSSDAECAPSDGDA
jgi:UDP-N-acetylglucosamine transferase subunit ALG13